MRRWHASWRPIPTSTTRPSRYADLLDAEPLDREATVALVAEVGDWAEAQIAGAPQNHAADEAQQEDSPS